MAVHIQLDSDVTERLTYATVGSRVDEFTLVENTIDGVNRWSYTRKLTISDQAGNFWQHNYEEPATEMQDVSDFGDFGEPTDWVQVVRTTPATWNWTIA